MASSLLHQLLTPLFKSWEIKPTQLNRKQIFLNDDFGRQIDRLLVAAPIDQKVSSPLNSLLAGKPMWEGITFKDTFYNLKNTVSFFGLEMSEASAFYYVRDSFIPLKEGLIGYVFDAPSLEKVMQKVYSSNLYLDKTATTRTRNQLFNHWSGYSPHYLLEMKKDLARLSLKSVPLKSTYVEGGNLFRMTNLLQKEVLLVGEDHLLQSLMLLEEQSCDWNHLAKERLGLSFAEKVATFTALNDQEIAKYAEEMFSLGLIKHQEKTGLIGEKELLNLLLAKFFVPGPQGRVIAPEERGWFKDLAVVSKLVEPLKLNENELKVLAFPVAEYLAKLQLTKELMALDLQVAQEDLHFVSQVSYHLDAFLAPAPNGGVFLVDFAFLRDLLKSIQSSSASLQLTPLDQELLEGYSEAAQKFNIELGPMLERVQEQLKAAGLTVIPTPGHLLYEPKRMYEEFPMPSEGMCINFINALTGYSQKRNAYFYITFGLHAGDKLGGVLMEMYSAFLQYLLPGICSCYVGYNPERPDLFIEGLDFWNRLETQSGIHCFTFPF